MKMKLNFPLSLSLSLSLSHTHTHTHIVNFQSSLLTLFISSNKCPDAWCSFLSWKTILWMMNDQMLRSPMSHHIWTRREFYHSNKRKTYMIRKHHVAVLLANHANIFYMGLTINTQSHTKCTYIIDREHSHMILCAPGPCKYFSSNNTNWEHGTHKFFWDPWYY